MDLISNNTQLLSLSASPQKIYSNNLGLVASRIKKYEELLYKIAISFGTSNNDSRDLVQEICSYANTHYKDQKNLFSLRIWLSKLMVHKCIFIISSRLFSQNIDTQTRPAYSVYNLNYKISSEARLQDMPLSFLAVYILNNEIGFSEVEIAEILNTSLFKVKERFKKAFAFTNY